MVTYLPHHAHMRSLVGKLGTTTMRPQVVDQSGIHAGLYNFHTSAATRVLPSASSTLTHESFEVSFCINPSVPGIRDIVWLAEQFTRQMLPCLGCSLLVKGVQTYQLP